MPYIPQEQRTHHTEIHPQTPGQLNYAITQMIRKYLNEHGGESYYLLNEVVGVLECAKLEFYRRIVAEYEDLKINMNGDVYF